MTLPEVWAQAPLGQSQNEPLKARRVGETGADRSWLPTPTVTGPGQCGDLEQQRGLWLSWEVTLEWAGGGDR